MASSMSAAASSCSDGEPGHKRRRILDAGGPIEDDEAARQKMRDARVYARGVDGTYGDWVGFDPDNVGDVKSLRWSDADARDINAIKPMGYFAWKGDLPMMRWLYVNGADTRDVDACTNFPMYFSADNGNLEVCKWLFDHGAAKDIKRRTHGGRSSPLFAAFYGSSITDHQSYQNVSRWLILSGALCKDDGSGKLDIELMQNDLGIDFRFARERKALFEWATDLHRARTSFLLFLSGALSRPKHAYHTRRSSSPVRILSGESGVLELIGDYVGFVRGREARIIRQLTEMLPDMLPDFD